ncbi:hypothetical protein SLS60_007355 [Paraconiothyrium brasiliense]|uniref:Ankyrin repeat protein n=1 Tax=Paraconiothyrium brasiliense TaxID=300254 RepID=A0ABR3R5B4_9PLEO
MSFGFGIGDLVAVVKLADKIRERFVDAPSEYKNVRDEDNCQRLLEELNQKLERYTGIDEKVTGRLMVSNLWKRIRWDQKEIDKCQSRIKRSVDDFKDHLDLLNSVTVDEIKTEVDRLHERQDDREQQELRQNVLDWLSTVDYHAQQRDAICRRQEGTGQWLLTSEEHKSWLETPGSTMFCPGIPGAGKTVLCAIMIEALHKLAAADSDVCLAYYYFSYHNSKVQTLDTVVASLARQLLERQPMMPQALIDRYNQRQKQGSFTFDELATMYGLSARASTRTYIVLDALDEYSECDTLEIKALMQSLFILQKSLQLNIVATSQLVGQVSQRVVDSTEGMFLLAQLHMDNLRGQPTRGNIKRALKTLPQGPKGLDGTYDLAMVRINSQNPEKVALAKEILEWVVHSARPLTVPELLDAVAIQPGTKELDEDFRPCPEDLDSLCMGLVIIDTTLDIVRLVHYTTQEYFERKNLFPEAHSNIARTCATYLSFDCIVRKYLDSSLTVPKFWEDRRLHNLRRHYDGKNHFHEYAARSWRIHAAKVSSSVRLEFLRSSPDVLNSFWIYNSIWPYDERKRGARVRVSLLGAHLAARFGFEDTLVALIEDGQSPEAEDQHGSTPLFYATWGDQASTATCLVYKYRVDVNHRDSDGKTPLMHAVRNGSLNVSRVLLGLKYTDINVVPGLIDQQFGEEIGPLLEAILHGKPEIAILLATSDQHTFGEEQIQPAIIQAVFCGQTDVLRAILGKYRADFKYKSGGVTNLMVALCSANVDNIKLLLSQYDGDFHERDDFGGTLLHHAAVGGHLELVDTMISVHGVNPHRASFFYLLGTPLMVAASWGQTDVVDLLASKHGANPLYEDEDGWTPLILATLNRHMETMELLIAKYGADPHAPNSKTGKYLVHYLMQPCDIDFNNRRHQEMLTWLIKKHNVELMVRDTRGRLPFFVHSSGAIQRHSLTDYLHSQGVL